GGGGAGALPSRPAARHRRPGTALPVHRHHSGGRMDLTLTRNQLDQHSIAGVVTTGIYCLPTCSARPKPENVRWFANAAAAEAEGFRPCLRCRPRGQGGSIMTTLAIAEVTSTIGKIVLAVRAGRLCALEFGPRWPRRREKLRRRFGRVEFRAANDPGGITGRLAAYFAGTLDALAPIPVDPGGTPF